MENMKAEHLRVDWLRALWWFLASTIGFGLVGVLLHFPSGFPPNNGANLVIGNAVFGAILGAVSGIVVGSLQWLALRGRLSRASQWIGTTVLGLGVIHAVGDGLPDPIAIPTVQAIGGIVLGIMQWLLLRREFSRAGWWVLASIAGWLIGLSLGLAIADAIGLMGLAWTPTVGITQHGVVGVVTGIVSGLMTGGALVWLLRDVQTKK